MELYKWQVECLEQWKQHNYKGIVNVVTGAGKTMLSLAAIKELSDILQAAGRQLHVRIVVPTTWLAQQWKTRIEETLPELISDKGIGQIGGNRRDPSNRFFTIYVINSARYTIARHIQNDIEEGFDILLIADECHHYGAPENRKIFDYRKRQRNIEAHVFTLGLSATPDCPEYDTILKPALGDEIYSYGFETAIKEKTVSSYHIGQIALSFTATELAEYDDLSSRLTVLMKHLKEEYPFLKDMKPGDFFRAIRHLASEEEELPSLFLNLSFQRAGVSQNASARILCGISLIRLLGKQENILIFCERISQAEELYTRLREIMPGEVVRYHSKLTKDLCRTSLDQFRTGQVRILISCRALDEGMDVPSVGVGIVLSCCGQSRQRIQRLGRILRRGEKKESAVLYYLHIKESAEDSAYLPDRVDPSRIFFLDYLRGEDAFLNHSYEALAEKLWLHALHIFPEDEEKLKELRLCLDQGLVRQDWLFGKEWYDKKISESQDRHERNYWICMKRISILHAQSGHDAVPELVKQQSTLVDTHAHLQGVSYASV